jgi:hypothetical protein
MSSTGQTILNYAETILALTSQSGPIATQLPSGTGEGVTPTIDGTTQFCLWITEGMERLARLCVPVSDVATATASQPGPGGIIGPFSEIQSTAGRTLYSPTYVSIGNTNLQATNLGFLNNTVWFPPAPDGDPTAWANVTTFIDLGDYTSNPTFTIQGYFLPIPVTATSTPIDPFFDDYMQRTVAFYVAWMVCAKNRDNTVLQSREVACLNEFVGGVKELYSRLVLTDITLPAIFPQAPIDSLLNLVKQVTPRA